MIKTLRIAIVAVLLLAAGNVLALGLGQIEVKSRINQPLLAEIPIVSTTPGELQALQARLASPETFRRVGLQPPQGIAADLRFSLGSDVHGRPVIRVTTVAPVNQAVLNFLIEVDWGEGRLVREYSALIDIPRTASAPVQPAISAPVVAAPNVVQRPLAPMPADMPTEAAPEATPIATTPLPPELTTTAAAPVAITPAPVAEPVPPPMGVAEPPAERAPASTAVALPPPEVVAAGPAPAPAPSRYGPIKAGETLSEIASSLDQAGGYSLDQSMLALLRANPDAFLSDNINLLRQGAVLRVPGDQDRASISANEAQLVVREQMQQWRQARRPVLQPEGALATNAPTRDVTPVRPKAAPAKSAPAKPVAAATKSTTPPPATAKPANVQRQAQARLEIVPAAVPGKATGTRSGTNAGGEGSMLQQQLQQRDEDLAARKAEISDLKERVAELENLKQQQTQLLTMKDTELAAAQQRLADARKAAANTPAANQPAPATAAQVTQSMQPAAETQPHASNVMPWLWGGLAVVALGLLAWLFSRRRSAPPAAPGVRRSFDSEALAASMRVPAEAIPPTQEARDAMVEAEHPAPPSAMPAQAESPIDMTELSATPAAHVDAPTWHSGHSVKAGAEPDAAALTANEPRFVPPAELPSEPAPEPASAEQRMKLARAFLDIGDDHSAKQLLVELMDGADPAMRTDAAKLLRELG